MGRRFGGGVWVHRRSSGVLVVLDDRGRGSERDRVTPHEEIAEIFRSRGKAPMSTRELAAKVKPPRGGLAGRVGPAALPGVGRPWRGWASGVMPRLDRRLAQNMERFDVGIIGAGIHGASAAFHLAGRGLRTVVIDKQTPGSGTTRRSSGVCRATYRNEYLAAAAREGIEFLPPDRLRSEHPWFALDGIAAGIWEPGAGYADPIAAAFGLLRSAEELGAELRMSARVTSIRPRESGGVA